MFKMVLMTICSRDSQLRKLRSLLMIYRLLTMMTVMMMATPLMIRMSICMVAMAKTKQENVRKQSFQASVQLSHRVIPVKATMYRPITTLRVMTVLIPTMMMTF